MELPKFDECRKRLIELYDQNPNEACKALNEDPKVKAKPSINTVRRLFSNISSSSFVKHTQESVIAHINHGDDADFYYWMLDTINIPKDDQVHLHSYIGKYKYYRKSSKGKMVAGRLKIHHANGIFRFCQTGTESTTRENKYEGFAYFLLNRIYLIGQGDRYYRPIVFMQSDSIDKDPLIGAVVSVTSSESGSLPYAAKFLLYHESHEEYGNKTSDQMKIVEQLIDTTDQTPGILIIAS